MMNLSQSEQKVLAARTAVETLVQKGLIFSGMKIGLGTGSTALPAVKRLSEYIADGTLKDIKAVVTSFQTENACADWGIPVYSFKDRLIGGELDLAIDGADEIDNMYPSCRSCNHYKHTLTIEKFRKSLECMPNVLMRDSVTYKNAVRYGLIKHPETCKIEFYFEKRGKNNG